MTTHNDIYNRFMIEYDKANITSSYPSLTKTEAVAILNKAYNALISQKVTGNNPRRALFEADLKAVEDLRPLIQTDGLAMSNTTDNIENQYRTNVPSEMLYYLQSYVDDHNLTYNTELVTHQTAQLFKLTANNTPWIETPVVYLEGQYIYVLLDPDMCNSRGLRLYITYIKKPWEFSVNTIDEESGTLFELSESVAEELINLAILFATEITESPRFQTKGSSLQLES